MLIWQQDRASRRDDSVLGDVSEESGEWCSGVIIVIIIKDGWIVIALVLIRQGVG